MRRSLGQTGRCREVERHFWLVIAPGLPVDDRADAVGVASPVAS